MTPSIKIIGAGLAGATIAQQLAEHGFRDIEVYDGRSHVGGNVHTYRDISTGVMVHAYGPHIFHTDDASIWRYVNRFCRMWPYTQRTKALSWGEIFSLPINLHTINQVFHRSMSPEEARQFIREKAVPCPTGEPESFEQLAVSLLGADLYARFLRDYTVKQWGRHPSELPASVLKRLPIRFNYDDNAYDHPYQGIPVSGYTNMVENMLDHPSIKVKLGCKTTRQDWRYSSDNTFVFYSGAIDEWFDYARGTLPYRTLDFETIIDLSTLDHQGCSVLNSCDLSEAWTRSTEHRHFAPWEKHHNGTIVTREFSRECDARNGDIHYYPVRLAKEPDMFRRYAELALREDGVAFVGRLGTYQYLDMDKTISASFQRAEKFRQTGR